MTFALSLSDLGHALKYTFTLTLMNKLESKLEHALLPEYCGKKQIECGSGMSVLLSTTIFVITGQHCDHSVMNIAVDRSTDTEQN